ncbi:unnamed protein product [Didymodactylos carnosus]|uniref:Uncharacterized protein n=1 Tax=Didymodactylos carnosus TaxID=1234261 RepID=A0A814C2H5_9BILA|nr:unnamed protein product [Didymodactylos carnosus]CAF1031979.1 unnamed protein product [Didymodactylos carnosus]CAF3715105.1 unnamed protein product [Didymodactylos carnosus]CAF3800199.1 unnamed protein product [Didymodactylos carnosus]
MKLLNYVIKRQQVTNLEINSIMSSIDDLFLISTSPSSTQHTLIERESTFHNKEIISPSPFCSNGIDTLTSSLVLSTKDEIERLQTELDQLYDKLDDISRENQSLKNRIQDYEILEEENEFLYAERQKLKDEIERGRVRELLIEQELKTLQDKLKTVENDHDLKDERSTKTDTSQTTANISNFKLKIDWLHRTNNQLELEVVRIRDELQLANNKYEQCKRDLYQKDEHYKNLLAAIDDNQRLPQELSRLEKLNVEQQNQLDNQKKEYDIKIHDLEEHNEKREQKYSSLYESLLKLQSDYRQKEINYVSTMDDVIRQREELRLQVNELNQQYEQLQHEHKILKTEMESQEEINKDLKLALTSSTNDAQSVYTQFRQLNTSLSELQTKYDRDIKDRDDQIDRWRIENKNFKATYDAELVQARSIIVQLEQDKVQYNVQIGNLRSTTDKLHSELAEKQSYIEHIQSDLSERSVLHTNINTQLSQENKNRAIKIIELEQSLSHEQQRVEVQRSLQELQADLLKTKASAKEANEKSAELEKRLYELDKHLEENLRTQLSECTEPSRREISSIRGELITKSEQLTIVQHSLDEEKLKRQRLEMKLKRLKDEYIVLRKEIHQRTEENDLLQHELVECRFKNDYNVHITNQTLNSLRTNENDQQPTTTAVQLYLKEKADNQHWQLKCRTYQQKLEHLQKNYELAKQKYKQRLQEERDSFDRAKTKYVEHMRHAQRDLQDTRSLLGKETEFKLNQEQSFQQLIDERRQLLTRYPLNNHRDDNYQQTNKNMLAAATEYSRVVHNRTSSSTPSTSLAAANHFKNDTISAIAAISPSRMVDKDAKVREMRRENLLLTSKIQVLEDQMENLNDRVDRTLRERNKLRREIANVRFDSNLSAETSSRSSPVTITNGLSRPTTTHTETSTPGWHNSVHYAESFGFNGFHENNLSSMTTTNVST